MVEFQVSLSLRRLAPVLGAKPRNSTKKRLYMHYYRKQKKLGILPALPNVKFEKKN